jgi:hypothetical protein
VFRNRDFAGPENPGKRRAQTTNKEEKSMLKTICIATLTTMMALAPAYSGETPKECTDAHMKQMDAMIAKMTDATKKKEATTALDMSKAEMKKGNMEGCMKYMKEAHTAMGLH